MRRSVSVCVCVCVCVCVLLAEAVAGSGAGGANVGAGAGRLRLLNRLAKPGFYNVSLEEARQLYARDKLRHTSTWKGASSDVRS